MSHKNRLALVIIIILHYNDSLQCRNCKLCFPSFLSVLVDYNYMYNVDNIPSEAILTTITIKTQVGVASVTAVTESTQVDLFSSGVK